MSSSDELLHPFAYRTSVLDALETHGFRPTVENHPRDVYDLLKRIYTFEIREAKLRHQEKGRILGPQPVGDLRRSVHRLRARYPVLSLHWRDWVEAAPPARASPKR